MSLMNIANSCPQGNTVVAIIKALGGNLVTGMCKCPAHDDHTPSLHVSEGRNEKPLLYCHAGCSQEAVLKAVRARGLWSSKREPFVPDPELSSHKKEYRELREDIRIARAANDDDGDPVSTRASTRNQS